MKIAKLISAFALAATIVPSLLFFSGLIDHVAVKWMALLGTLLWFLATPIWMEQELPIDSTEVEI